MNKVYIIAEAGVNHNGDIELAKNLIDIAYSAGADAVKFQIFKAENLATPKAKKAKYQLNTTNKKESQLKMLQSLELKNEEYLLLKKYAKKLGIDFLVSAFDQESLKFILDDLKVKKLKIPSGEITNGPFILEHAKSGLDIILSTGMSDLNEIKRALSVIAFGYLYPSELKKPNKKNFELAYESIEGKNLIKKKVTILHCTTEYPAPIIDLNLKAIDSMRNYFDTKIGYSDHSKTILASLVSASLNIDVIEKHFTIDQKLDGPDQKASLSPTELKTMISSIRQIEKMMGDGKKKASKSELKNIVIARKSMVASKDIKKGQVLSKKNITFKRAGEGKSPMDFWDILNTKANKNFKKNEIIN
tara:strand:- start:490 stop:1569 length:1080 start_codon:yes stop_codon:yes gene_type:complete